MAPEQLREIALPAVTMPLQIIGALRGFPTGLLWILMFSFELALASGS
jgi:hypothetical protein